MYTNRTVTRAAGFADTVGPQVIRAETAIRNAREVLALRGYVAIETPIIEQSELFLRKSGGVLSSQMYAFSSPDGANVSVRPELTAPVIRHALEEPDAPFPRRYQYASPVLRYPEHSSICTPEVPDRSRQFTQVGAELLGPDEPESDGEIIAAACETAAAVGVGDFNVVLGHAGLTWALLEQLRLPKRAGQFLALNLDRLADEKSAQDMVSEAERLKLVTQSNGVSGNGLQEALSATQLASVSAGAGTQGTSGGRPVDRITTRLENKLTEVADERDFKPSFQFMSRLASISGDPDSALNDLMMLCEEYVLVHNLKLDPAREVDQIRRIIDSAISEGVSADSLTVNLGLPVGLAYYIGMIFEIRLPDNPNLKLGGGGRYDGLANALGSDTSLPALGFALDLDTILATFPEGPDPKSAATRAVLARAADADSDEVSRVARKLREANVQAIVAYGDINKAKELAESVGTDSVVVVKADGSTERISL